ncbi:MAG TPA: glutamate 5-kinase, partial [Armatimonadetes bacterium]|nr:glutamate 5-kinase [Armatimonadota bacterium]
MSRNAHNIVIKVGTAVLTGGGRELDVGYMDELVRQIASLYNSNNPASNDGRGHCKPVHRVALVTSGAIRAGMTALGLLELNTIAEQQAAAAIGQGLLMSIYRELFARHEIPVAQVLLTRDDVAVRSRFLNARHTFQKLFEWGALPIVNENDTVAVDEIKFGDNDHLAALVGLIVDADLIIMLSDVDGFYLHPKGRHTRPLDTVTEITPQMREAAEDSKTSLGTGGMVSKLEAAEVAMSCGMPMVIAHGREKDVLLRIVSGEHIGTFFMPARRLRGKKRWLAYAPRARGKIIVNVGAMEQIVHHGKSLLPVGIINIEGS